MLIGGPFKTTAARHGPFFFIASVELLGFGDGDGACKTEGEEHGFLIGSKAVFYQFCFVLLSRHIPNGSEIKIGYVLLFGET